MAFFRSDFEKTVREMVVPLRSRPLNPKKTVVVNMDTINGFFVHGALASPRLAAIIPQIVRVNEYFGFSRKLFFIDRHYENSPEFSSYPEHCVDLSECEVIDELKPFADPVYASIIYKNSTNGFLSAKFAVWLKRNMEQYDHYVITGGATDICVMQFALSLKAYFNEHNIKKEIAVIENAVQTYDNEAHDGDRMHYFALYNLMMNGVRLYSI